MPINKEMLLRVLLSDDDNSRRKGGRGSQGRGRGGNFKKNGRGGGRGNASSISKMIDQKIEGALRKSGAVPKEEKELIPASREDPCTLTLSDSQGANPRAFLCPKVHIDTGKWIPYYKQEGEKYIYCWVPTKKPEQKDEAKSEFLAMMQRMVAAQEEQARTFAETITRMSQERNQGGGAASTVFQNTNQNQNSLRAPTAATKHN